MNKQIPCFICKKQTEVKDERAIATLCEEHKTDTNLKTLSETPVHQLLKVLHDNTEAKVDKLIEEINALKKAPKVVEEKRTINTGNINEYGELI